MFRKRIPGMLDQYDQNVGQQLIDSLRVGLGTSYDSAFEKFAAKTTPNFAIWTDEDLAELIARNRPTGETELARSEMRTRESWRTPARWSFIVACLALAVSIVAVLISLGK